VVELDVTSDEDHEALAARADSKWGPSTEYSMRSPSRRGAHRPGTEDDRSPSEQDSGQRLVSGAFGEQLRSVEGDGLAIEILHRGDRQGHLAR